MHAWCIWLVNKDIVGCLHRNRILPLGDGAPCWRQIAMTKWQWQRHTQKREVCMHQESIVGPTHLLWILFALTKLAGDIYLYISISIGSSAQLNIYDYVFWCCRIEAWQSSRSVSLLRSHPSVASYLKESRIRLLILGKIRTKLMLAYLIIWVLTLTHLWASKSIWVLV